MGLPALSSRMHARVAEDKPVAQPIRPHRSGVVALLCEKGADTTVRDWLDHETPLQVARRRD